MADGRNRSVAAPRPDGGEPDGIIVDRLSPDGVVYDVVELSGGDPWIDPLATRSTDRNRPGDDRPRRVATWSPGGPIKLAHDSRAWPHQVSAPETGRASRRVVRPFRTSGRRTSRTR